MAHTTDDRRRVGMGRKRPGVDVPAEQGYCNCGCETGGHLVTVLTPLYGFEGKRIVMQHFDAARHKSNAMRSNDIWEARNEQEDGSPAIQNPNGF